MNLAINGNSLFSKVDLATAKENAQKGGLSLFSLVAPKHGHIGTFSVGTNIELGTYANIGSNKNNDFVNSIGKRNFQYFILVFPK